MPGSSAWRSAFAVCRVLWQLSVQARITDLIDVHEHQSISWSITVTVWTDILEHIWYAALVCSVLILHLKPSSLPTG